MESQFPNDDGKGSTLCRQSSSRWTPTTEQIRILKDLYYNNGVRSPSADQIQKISAKLRQYGNIEGKNVFYWFQNHKARERQKKRLTTDAVAPMQRSGFWKNTDPGESFYPCKYPNNVTSGVPSSSACAPGLVGNYPYGSLAMEKSFRDCSLSAGFNGGNGNNLSWGGAPDSVNNIIPQMPYPFLDHPNNRSGGSGEDDQYEQEEEHEIQLIETLPLFPMHGDEDGFIRCNKQQYCPTNWYQYPTNGNMGCSSASLELTLNSYGTGWTNNSS